MQQENNTNWFATSMQEAYPPTQPSRKRSRIFKIVVIAACILLLVGGGSAGLYFLRPTCLTAADYQQLAGAPYEGRLDATSAFYTTLVHFQTNKTAYDDSDSQGDAQLKLFADFYKAHSSASIAFTLNATYPEDIYRGLTEQRLAAARQSLVALGVPEDKITTEAPKQITPEEPLDEDSESIGSHNTIALSITSQEGCR